MSFSELKDRHVAATATVNTLRDRLNQKRQQLLDTDGGPVLSECWTDMNQMKVLFPISSISINSSNSNIFVSGSCDATARLWDTRIASRAIRTYQGHYGDVNTVKFFPDGQRFGTGSDDGTCRLFDMRTGHQLQVYSQQQANNDQDIPIVTSIAFSISGRLLFAGYSNGDCYVWDTLLAEV
ncbi:hypothetical protein BHE74_00022781 [Ensete ventricosum]|uniref:Uncharacterized protein n=1 Tax=Ensete ventricosum TaxID=4639 RepID=A0A426ZDY7_ENSVE|nr:hypothetical protein B296_00024314 [Ensete ventricosum]RWW69607.1 hypothetical protein BHE74_00022781 [Ensete ventricosum]